MASARRVHSKEFKIQVVREIEAGKSTVRCSTAAAASFSLLQRVKCLPQAFGSVQASATIWAR